jgi:transcriptional regulator GlxA family with amidase domain
VDAALHFAGAVATGQLGSEHAASTLLDTLLEWERLSGDGLGNKQERITAVRRRTYVGEARAWMRLHLGEPIGIQQAAAAVAVSPRTLQYAFLTELGRTPMAELKRLRLRALRQLLQGPGQRHTSIADLMVRSGLLACGSTAAEYRRYCGESPHETREQMRNSI